MPMVSHLRKLKTMKLKGRKLWNLITGNTSGTFDRAGSINRKGTGRSRW